MSDNKYISENGVEAQELLENLKYAAKHNKTSHKSSTRRTGREYERYISFIEDKLGTTLSIKVDASKLWKDFKEVSKKMSSKNQFLLIF